MHTHMCVHLLMKAIQTSAYKELSMLETIYFPQLGFGLQPHTLGSKNHELLSDTSKSETITLTRQLRIKWDRLCFPWHTLPFFCLAVSGKTGLFETARNLKICLPEAKMGRVSYPRPNTAGTVLQKLNGLSQCVQTHFTVSVLTIKD